MMPYSLGMLGRPRVIEDVNAYKIIIRVKGFPAGHHPNSNRPYFRKVKKIIPLIYFMNTQNCFLVHPSLMPAIRAKFGQQS